MTNFEEDPNYEECIITYLDVLGFRSHMGDKSAEEVRRILRRFRRVAQPRSTNGVEYDDEEARMEPRVEIFSDAIMRARVLENEYKYGVLAHELMDLQYIQIECVANGIVIRGAVTIGHLHLGDELEGPYFGPGLIRAYEMERKEVVFPRIAIDEAVIERFESDPLLRSENNYDYEIRFVQNLLKEDQSGLKFIDYLNADPGEFDSGYAGLIELFQRHRKLIVQGLEAVDAANVVRKYTWLKRYHNSRIEAEIERVELDVFEPEFESTMRDVLEPLIIQ